MSMTVFIGEACFNRVVYIMYVFKHDKCADNICIILILNVGLNLLFNLLNSVHIFVFNRWTALFKKLQNISIVEK